MSNTTPRRGKRDLPRIVGPLCLFAVMAALLWASEPLSDDSNLTWRNLAAMLTIPIISTYAGYQIGWLNGYHAGWQKARGYEK